MELDAADARLSNQFMTLLALGQAEEAAEELLDCRKNDLHRPASLIDDLRDLATQQPVHSFQLGRVWQVVRRHVSLTKGWTEKCDQALADTVDRTVTRAVGVSAPAEQRNVFAALHMLAVACLDLRHTRVDIHRRLWLKQWLPKLAKGSHVTLQALFVACDALHPSGTGTVIKQAMANPCLCKTLRQGFQELANPIEECLRDPAVSRDEGWESLLCEVQLRDTLRHQLDHMPRERSIREYMEHELRWRLRKPATRAWLFQVMAEKITTEGINTRDVMLRNKALLWELRAMWREDYHNFCTGWAASTIAVMRSVQQPASKLSQELSAILSVCDLPVTMHTIEEAVASALTLGETSSKDQCYTWLVAILGLEGLQRVFAPEHTEVTCGACEEPERKSQWRCGDGMKDMDPKLVSALESLEAAQQLLQGGLPEAWSSCPLFGCVGAALRWLAQHVQRRATEPFTENQAEGPSRSSPIPVERLDAEVRHLAQELLPSVGDHISRECQAHLELLQGLLTTYSYPKLLLPCCIPNRWTQLPDSCMADVVLHLGGRPRSDAPALLPWKPEGPKGPGSLRLVCKAWRASVDTTLDDLYVTGEGLSLPLASRLINLKGLHLRFNPADNLALEPLADLCRRNPQLATLALYEPHGAVYDHANDALPVLMPLLTSLRRLAFDSIIFPIQRPRVHELLEPLSRLSQLEELHIREHLRACAPSYLEPPLKTLAQLSKLTKLVLSENRPWRPLGLEALSGSLQDLRLGPGLSVPDLTDGLSSVASLTQLHVLDISAVYRSQNLPRYDVAILAGLSSLHAALTALDISHFYLPTWPDVLSHLTRLEQLNMRGHLLTTLPEAILQLQALQHLDVSLAMHSSFQVPPRVARFRQLRRLVIDRRAIRRGQYIEKTLVRTNGVQVVHDIRRNAHGLQMATPRYPISMQPQYEDVRANLPDRPRHYPGDGSADDTSADEDDDSGEDGDSQGEDEPEDEPDWLQDENDILAQDDYDDAIYDDFYPSDFDDGQDWEEDLDPPW